MKVDTLSRVQGQVPCDRTCPIYIPGSLKMRRIVSGCVLHIMIREVKLGSAQCTGKIVHIDDKCKWINDRVLRYPGGGVTSHEKMRLPFNQCVWSIR